MAGLATIMRHEAQLRQVAAQIREANSIINDAKGSMEEAANTLCENWEGDARDAFYSEQLNYKTWLQQMIQIIDEMINTIDQVVNKYANVEQSVMLAIKNK